MFPDPRNRFLSRWRRQRGVGLPMAIFLITVMALIVATIAQLQQSTGEAEALDILSTRAYYAAESGAQLAMTRVLPDDPDAQVSVTACTDDVYQQGFDQGGLSGCSVSVDCTSVDDGAGRPLATLTSTGECGTAPEVARRTIEVRVQ